MEVKIFSPSCSPDTQRQNMAPNAQAKTRSAKNPTSSGSRTAAPVFTPDRSYVQGIVLEYYPKGTLKSLLRRSDPPIESSMKKRWAAQIAHGISAMHAAGVIHGDLRCENVIVDENDNAHIIDICNGAAFMMGWHPVLDRFDDPRRDVYSLAVTIWEMIHDGDDPPGISNALPIDWRRREYGKSITDLIEHCLCSGVRGQKTVHDKDNRDFGWL
jgi:serine/threonine protein kinase